MGKYRRLLVFVFALLFLPMMCHGQLTTTPVSFPSISNNDSGCTTTNCWTELGTHGSAIAITSASMAGDGTIVVSDTGCKTYKYDLKSDSFLLLLAASSGVCTVAAQDADTVYGLGAYNGTTNLYLSASGGAWQAVPWDHEASNAQWTALGAGADATVCGINNLDGNLYVYFPGASSWSHIGNHAASISACTDTSDISYVDSSNNAWSYAGGTSWNPVASGVLQYSPNFLFVLTSDLVQTKRGSTWTTIKPPASGIHSIFGSTGLLAEYALGGGNIYHLNSFKLTAQSTSSGNYAHYCQVIDPPACVGATHNYTHNLHFGAQQGTTQHASVNPVTQVSVTGQDTTVACDPFLDASDNCTISDQPTGTCNNMGDLSVPIGYSCLIPPSTHKVWDQNSTVTVYFNQIMWSGLCPGSDWCFVFDGIDGWVTCQPQCGILASGTQFVNGGLVDASRFENCVDVLPSCDLRYPFIWVNMASDNASHNYGIRANKNGKYSLISMSSGLRGDQIGLQVEGGHEEGHDQGDADCYPPGGLRPFPCGAAGPGQTIMWWNYDPSQGLLPTPCDIYSANLWYGAKTVGL